MAIEKCGECGKDVSSLASWCPHCGAPRVATKAKPPAVRPAIRILGAIVLGFVVIGIWLSTGSPAPDSAPPAPDTAPPASNPAATAANTAIASPATPAPSPPASAKVVAPPIIDLSKPIFTRENAIICPVSSFESQLAGHSVSDLRRLFDEPGDDLLERRVRAGVQDCDVYQGGVRLTLLTRDIRSQLLPIAQGFGRGAIVSLLKSKDWVILEDLSSADLPGCCRVTREDQIRN